MRDLVVGPGHSLNELVSKLLHAGLNGESHTEWELYSGIYGLYARHNDDWVGLKSYRCIDSVTLDHYNDVVRNATTPNIINEFEHTPFYVNVTYEVMKDIYKDLDGNIFCSYLDMENYPETRFHFAMMEFSEDAAEDLDYNVRPKMEEVAMRVATKHEVETQARQEIDVNWINVGKVLNKDYSDFPERLLKHTKHFDTVVDQYNWYNRITDPSMQYLVKMPWQEIVDIRHT